MISRLTIKDALKEIKDDVGSMNRVVAWIAACIDTTLLDREKEAVARVKDKVGLIYTNLNTISSEITTPLERLLQSKPKLDLNRKPRVDLLKAPE